MEVYIFSVMRLRVKTNKQKNTFQFRWSFLQQAELITYKQAPLFCSGFEHVGVYLRNPIIYMTALSWSSVFVFISANCCIINRISNLESWIWCQNVLDCQNCNKLWCLHAKTWSQPVKWNRNISNTKTT